jgi:hypothetical protein
MYFALAFVLLVLGGLAFFVAPWLGGAVLLAAILLVIGAFFWGGATVASADPDEPHEPPPAPKLPGPGDPESGVR